MIIYVTTELVRSLEGESLNTIDIGAVLNLFFGTNRDDSEGKRVKRVCEFWDERYVKNRSITCVDWSPKANYF